LQEILIKFMETTTEVQTILYIEQQITPETVSLNKEEDINSFLEKVTHFHDSIRKYLGSLHTLYHKI